MSAICQASGKRCFPGPHGAKRACRKLPHKLRVYRCSSCGQWHVTKQAHRSEGPRQ